MKTLSALLLVITLSGCATQTGQSFSSDLIKPPAKGSAELVIYRPSEFAVPRNPSLKINGFDICDLSANSFMTINEPAGKLIIESSLWDYFGASKLAFKATAGHTYYISLRFNHDVNAASAVGGLIGSSIENAVSDNKGPFIISMVDKERALRELAGTDQSISCR